MAVRNRESEQEQRNLPEVTYIVGTLTKENLDTSELARSLYLYVHRRQPLATRRKSQQNEDNYWFDFMIDTIRKEGREATFAMAKDASGATIGVFGASLHPDSTKPNPVFFVYESVDAAFQRQGIGNNLFVLGAGELFYQGYTAYATTVNTYSYSMVANSELGQIFPQLGDNRTGLTYASISFNESVLRRAYAARGFSFDRHHELRVS